MPRAKYEDAIRWIANNDEPGEMDVEVVSGFISTLLVADLWGKAPEQVAKDIVRHKEQKDKPKSSRKPRKPDTRSAEQTAGWIDAIHNANREDESFFTKWERVIKNQGRKK